jgi:hypothetical protein
VFLQANNIPDLVALVRRVIGNIQHEKPNTMKEKTYGSLKHLTRQTIPLKKNNSNIAAE